MSPNVLIDLVGTIPIGLVLTDAEGNIMATNPLANTILDRQDNLRVEQERLRTDAGSRQISHLLDELKRGSVTAVAPLHRHSSNRPLLLKALLLNPAPPAGEPAFALLITDLDERPAPDPLLVKHLFGLTRVEAEITCRLAMLFCVADVAAAMGITVNTVRGHMKRIFLKTGSTKQSHLVDIILRSPVFSGGDETTVVRTGSAADPSSGAASKDLRTR